MAASLVLDLIILAVLLLFIILGTRRGLVLTLCGLLAIFVAFFGATFVSNTLCEPVANAIQPAIERHIEGTLRQSIQQQASDPAVETVSEPDVLPLGDVLEALKGSAIYQNLAQSFQQAVNDGVAKVTGSAAQSLAQYAARELARTFLFVVAFVAILVIWFLVSHALDLVAKLPVLSTANRVGGGIIGGVKGFLALCVCAWVFHSVLGLIPAQTVQGSFLLPFLLNPLNLVQRVQAATLGGNHSLPIQ